MTSLIDLFICFIKTKRNPFFSLSGLYDNINIYGSDSPLPPFPYGLVVRIPGFHPGGPGSIPGVGGRGFVEKITSNPFPIAGG